MRIRRIGSLHEMAAIRESWNRLAGEIPFRRWDWLGPWWEHYGRGREFYVLVVEDQEEVVGLAPWFLEPHVARGRVVRFLGSGEVCSDYLGVLAAPRREDEVAAALADWLIAAADQRGDDRWDLLELTAIEAADRATAALVAQLVEDGTQAHRRRGPNCWRIALPGSWEEYLQSLSKSHRKQIRRVERRLLETGRAVLHTAGVDGWQLDRGLSILAELHARRRESLGDSGRFASPSFAAFLGEAARRLAENHRAEVHWIELDGEPVAAELHLLGGGMVYAYQSGISPQALEEEPGRIIMTAAIRRAISQGLTAFDFLRGDEPYKAHWRAEERPLAELCLVPPRAAARIRSGAWLAGATMKNWVKAGITLTGMK